jgi:ferredoxin-NADP reductase/uncharacterized protein YcbX
MRPDQAGRVTGLYLYPLKSGAGIARPSLDIIAEGVAGDRVYMAVDDRGTCITARDTPFLLNIEATARPGGLHLRNRAHGTQLLVADTASGGALPAVIWGTDVLLDDCGDGAAEWLSSAIGRGCRLARWTARSLRDGRFASVFLPDTAPLLLANRESLREIEARAVEPFEIERFRPNILVEAGEPFIEDRWAQIRIGESIFDCVGPCDRCVMTTRDPTGGAGHPRHEPLRTLHSFRRGDDGNVYFGQFLVPRTLGRISANDEVEVLAWREPRIAPPARFYHRDPLRLALLEENQSAPPADALTLVCAEVVEETADCRSFYFSCPDRPLPSYRAGQFMVFDIPHPAGDLRRSYTISSSPHCPERISITVKRGDDGGASQWLHETMRPGMRLGARGPFGQFTLEDHPHPRLLMLSAGSGITPMMSMARWLLERGLPVDIVFLHSARDAGNVIFADTIADLARRFPDRFTAIVTITGDGAPAHARRGRLSLDLLRETVPDLALRQVLACGPEPFIALARELLAQVPGFDFARFAAERFAAAPRAEVAAGTYEVTLAVSGKEVCGQGAPVLLAVMREAGLPVESSCEMGLCGTCKCKVIRHEGIVPAETAIDPEMSVLTAQERAEGWVLSCVTVAKGTMTIER